MKSTVLRCTSDELVKMLTESVKTYLMVEKRGLQSQILFDLIKNYGNDVKFSDVDLNAVTDDDIIDVVDRREYKRNQNSDYEILIGDKVVIVKGTEHNLKYLDKADERMRNSNWKRDGKHTYQWQNREAGEEIFKNPFFKTWPKEYQRKALDNVKNGRKIKDNF